MSWLVNVLGFLLVIGVLVTVHEFGHFWVARRVGVKVLRFSVGFGRPLLQRRGADGTEYVLAAIPLGGYVKMLDEREAPVEPDQQSQAFNRKPLWARNAVIAAGPVFNFALAVIAYWLVFVIGALELRPVLGPVIPQSPAAEAGLQEGDELQRIGGVQVEAWDQVAMAMLDASDRNDIPVVVQRSSTGMTTLRLDLEAANVLQDGTDVLEQIGLQPWRPVIEPRIARIVDGSAAAGAGLAEGDLIRQIDQTRTEDWGDLVDAVRDRPGERVTVIARRDGGRISRELVLGSRGEGEQRRGVLGVVPRLDEDAYAGMRHEVREGPIAAVPRALDATWRGMTLTVRVLVKMVVGEASVKNLSGPISIAQYSGDSVSLGPVPFLKFLAIVSISLGILNLMPVPILDGGHLLYNAIEWVKGRPLSEAAQGVGQQIGMALLFMLMALAFYNDLNRLFGAGG
jgi:regulator of sigma E protease